MFFNLLGKFLEVDVSFGLKTIVNLFLTFSAEVYHFLFDVFGHKSEIG
jgi:hypothetical protein